MKNIIKRGFGLFLLSIVFIGCIRIIIDYGNLALIKDFKILMTLIYLAIWFYEGFASRLGFLKGLAIGALGSMFGIYVTVWSFVLSFSDKLDRATFVAIPWDTPMLWIINVLKLVQISKPMPYLLPLVTVTIVILTTALGSFIGKRFPEKNQEEITE